MLARLDIADVSLLSSTVHRQQSARDLGVVTDSRLSLSEHVAWAATINCVNCDKPSDGGPWMPPGRWSGLWLPVVQCDCTTASLTSWCDFCSQCRTLWPGWSMAHYDVTTSHRCFASCTGFQCVSASATRSSRCFIGVCPATSQAAWLTTADSTTSASDVAFCRHSNTGRRWHKVVLAIEHSLRQHLGSGTVCRLT